jgi:hypothetical protein
MQTSRASTSRFRGRSVLWASAIAASVAILSAAGCGLEETVIPGTGGAASGRGPTAGSASGGRIANSGGSSGSSNSGSSAIGSGGGAGISSGGAAGSGTLTGGGAGLGGSGGLASGGAGSGGVATGGAVSMGGNGNGGVGGSGKACVDVQPPPDPEWPGATCQNWANETTACTESWFSAYCDVSCNRCVPEGGGGGMSGAGGMAPKPCVDVQPPEDPEWPGATCENWVLEAEACGEAWFANYCDVSCGRCVPEGGGGGTGGTPAVDCSGEGLPNVTGGEGFATRYWDCCQTHCSQFNGHRCGQDGTSSTGNTQSACTGGGSFACYDEAPRAVSECLSYGHIAKTNPNCGGCYRIQFTGQGEHNANDPGSKLIKGKQMIVKVTNTGGDVAGNQFDLMIPGGGVGQFNACSRQWGSNDLGAQYGGFLTNCTGAHSAKKECVRQNCSKIPAGPAREGCLWFVDWFEVADNPKFTSQQTNCPF